MALDSLLFFLPVFALNQHDTNIEHGQVIRHVFAARRDFAQLRIIRQDLAAGFSTNEFQHVIAHGEPCVVWCDLNDESDEAKALGEIVFDDVLKGQRKHRFSVNKMDFDFNRKCDAYLIGDPMRDAVNRIWGLPVLVTTACTDGEALLLDTSKFGTALIREGIVMTTGYATPT